MKLGIIATARREIQIGAESKKCGTCQDVLVKFGWNSGLLHQGMVDQM